MATSIASIDIKSIFEAMQNEIKQLQDKITDLTGQTLSLTEQVSAKNTELIEKNRLVDELQTKNTALNDTLKSRKTIEDYIEQLNSNTPLDVSYNKLLADASGSLREQFNSRINDILKKNRPKIEANKNTLPEVYYFKYSLATNAIRLFDQTDHKISDYSYIVPCFLLPNSIVELISKNAILHSGHNKSNDQMFVSVIYLSFNDSNIVMNFVTPDIICSVTVMRDYTYTAESINHVIRLIKAVDDFNKEQIENIKRKTANYLTNVTAVLTN